MSHVKDGDSTKDITVSHFKKMGRNFALVDEDGLISVGRNFAQVAKDGKTYEVQGFRIKRDSPSGTRIRLGSANMKISGSNT